MQNIYFKQQKSNFSSLRSNKSKQQHLSQKIQEDDSQKTLSLSFFDEQQNVQVNDIIAFYDEIDIFSNQFGQGYIYSERLEFENLTQIQNQRIMLYLNGQSRIFQAVCTETKKLIVIKQISTLNLEYAIQKLDEYKIHYKIYQKYPTKCLELLIPIQLRKEDGYIIEAQVERAIFNLYDYSRINQFSKKQAYDIMFQMIEQLLNLHSMKIAHRDVKPQNILYVIDKGWLLSDFGESSEYEEVENIYNIRGTKYFLMPQLQNNIQFNTKVQQNLLKNDLYALVITVIIISSDKYISDVTNEIKQLNDHTLKQVLEIQNLHELQTFFQSHNRQYMIQSQLNHQQPIYQNLSDPDQIKNNEILIKASLLQLAQYLPDSNLKQQIIKFLEKYNFNDLYNNCSIYEGFHNLMHTGILKRRKKFDYFSIPQDFKHDCCRYQYLNNLFIHGFNEKVIIQVNQLLKSRYNQNIHLLLIRSYERLQLMKEQKEQLKIFNESLKFEHLNTQNQAYYGVKLGNYFQTCNNYSKFMEKLIRQQELVKDFEVPDFNKLFQNLNTNQDYLKAVEQIMQYFRSSILHATYNQYVDKVFSVVFMQITQLPIEIYKLFLIQVNKYTFEVIDLNRRASLLSDLGEVYLLQNNNKEFRNTYETIKLMMHDPDSWQQVTVYKLICQTLDLYSDYKQYNYKHSIQKINQSILDVQKVQLSKYQFSIAYYFEKVIIFFVQHKIIANYQLIKLILSIVKHLDNFQYQVIFKRNFESIQTNSFFILSQTKNYKRGFQIIKNCQLRSENYHFINRQHLILTQKIKKELKFDLYYTKMQLPQKFIYHQFLEK